MPPRDPPTRAGALLGRTALGPDGRSVGRVVDLVTEDDGRGRERVVAALVVHGPWGRLLGYDRTQLRGPWLLDALARALLRRNMTRVPWAALRLAPPER
jgi:hypothetical protein